MMTLFTSQEKTILPYTQNQTIEINNYIQENSIFYYVNPIIFIDNTTLSNFYTISDSLSDFPLYCKSYDKNKIVSESIQSFKFSFKKSIIHNNWNVSSSVCAKHWMGNLYFNKYLINEDEVENNIMVVSSGAVYNYNLSKVYQNFLNNSSSSKLEKSCIKWNEGSLVEEKKSCMDILDWF